MKEFNHVKETEEHRKTPFVCSKCGSKNFVRIFTRSGQPEICSECYRDKKVRSGELVKQ